MVYQTRGGCPWGLPVGAARGGCPWGLPVGAARGGVRDALGLAGSVGRLPLTAARVQELATSGGGR